MAVKTFSTGEVLTASDTNTYLANAGLVYITTAVVPASPASTKIQITNCFTSTYTNYRIVVNGVIPSATDSFLFSLGDGTATTGMYGSMFYDLYSGSGTGTLRRNNAGNIYVALNEAGTANAGFSIDVLQPQLSSQTQIFGNFWGRGFGGWNSGGAGSASFTGFAILPDGSGTFTNGTVTVYGYRKA